MRPQPAGQAYSSSPLKDPYSPGPYSPSQYPPFPVYGFPEGDPPPTGPTEYNVDTKLCLSVGSYLGIIQHLAKFGAVAIWFTDNRQHESSDWRYLGLLLVASVFNLWLPLLASHKIYMTHVRYEMSRLLKTPFPYLFLLDELILITVPFAGQRLGLVAELPILICIIVAVLNVLCFYLVLRREVINYQPLQHNDAFPHLTNSVEERTDDYSLKVIESSAFKIVIQNISPEPIKGDYIVVRKTREDRTSRRRATVKNKCQFGFRLEWWLDPGATINLIPETHSLQGAIQIKDFRSFGYDRKNRVETNIYRDVDAWKQHLCVRFIQKTLVELGKDVDCGLSKSTAIQIAIQTLQGIRAIHNRRILHGNLKLSNIVVDMDQTTVVLLGYGFNTWIFGNPSSVDGQEYSRADDIKHWFFLLLSLISPEWIERPTIAAGSNGDGAGTDNIQAKLEMYLPSYFHLPQVMNKIRKYVIMLKWYDCINYDYILTLLGQIDREEKWCDLEEPLDWLKPGNPSKIPRKTANNLKFCCVQ